MRWPATRGRQRRTPWGIAHAHKRLVASAVILIDVDSTAHWQELRHTGATRATEHLVVLIPDEIAE